MSENHVSVSERLRALPAKWRERPAAGWSAPMWVRLWNELQDEGATIGEADEILVALRSEMADELDALLSAEVPASTGEGLRERVEAAEALLRAVMKPAPDFDDMAYRVFRDSPALSSVADVLRDVAAALPSPTIPAAPLTQEKE